MSFHELDFGEDRQTEDKAKARRELEAAMASYHGPIQRLPMHAALRCRSCGHRGNAVVPDGLRPVFKCSACGSSLIAFRF